MNKQTINHKFDCLFDCKYIIIRDIKLSSAKKTLFTLIVFHLAYLKLTTDGLLPIQEKALISPFFFYKRCTLTFKKPRLLKHCLLF